MKKTLKKHPRIMEALTSDPWMCTEEALRKMLAIASYEGDVEALQTRLDSRDPETFETRVRDNVAIIPLVGPIFPKANMLTEVSGATALSQFALDFQAAEDNSEIDTILMDVSSPGGVISGINEMANVVKASTKKVVTYVGSEAASAAYWIASASDEIVADATASLGSIGVVASIPKKDDDDALEFTNTASPKKRMDVTSEEGEKELLSRLDVLADIFITAVATNRQTTVEAVKKDFGQGGVLIGQEAVDVGMADRLGSYEELLKELTESANTNYGGNIMDLSALTKDQLVAGRPDLVTMLTEQGKEEAKTEFTKVVGQKDEEVSALAEENKELKSKNETLSSEKADLEKKNIAFEEKAIGASAAGIMTAALKDSSIPERLHGKVAAQINKDDFVVEGSLDEGKYKEKVDAEVKDWEESLSAVGSSSIQGVGSSSRDGSGEESDDDAIVARLTGKNK